MLFDFRGKSILIEITLFSVTILIHYFHMFWPSRSRPTQIRSSKSMPGFEPSGHFLEWIDDLLRIQPLHTDDNVEMA